MMNDSTSSSPIGRIIDITTVMDEYFICTHCGESYDTDWLSCPYCGSGRRMKVVS